LSGFLLCRVYVGHHLHFNLSQREIKLEALKLLLWLPSFEDRDSLTFLFVSRSVLFLAFKLRLTRKPCAIVLYLRARYQCLRKSVIVHSWNRN